MEAYLEHSDIKPLIPKLWAELKAELRHEMEKEVFLTYPKGMQKHLCDGEVSHKTYQRVRTMWNNPKFPRIDKDGIKGVRLSDLNNYLDE